MTILTKWGSAVVIALIPVMITIVMIYGYLGESLETSVPYWSDENFYWLQINAFRVAGLNSGYFTYEEIPATTGFSRFGAHGPAFIITNGLISRVTGFEYNTLPFYNLGLITITLFGFILTIRLDRSQKLMISLWLATQWGLLLFLPLSFQETFHFSLAIILACFLHRQLNQQLTTPEFIFTCLLILYAAALRVTWALLFFPVLVFLPRYQTNRQRILAGIVALGLFLFCFGLFVYWAAPYPHTIARLLLSRLFQDPISTISFWIQYILQNTLWLGQGNILEILLRFQALALILILAIVFLAQRRTLKSTFAKKIYQWFKLPSQHLYLHIYLLVALLGLQLLLYDAFEWRDYRVFLPFIALSTLLFILNRQYRFVRLLCATNLVCIIFFFQTYALFNDTFLGVQEGQFDRYQSLVLIEQFKEDVDDYLIFDPNQSNPWCNTVLGKNFPVELLGLPAGIGYGITFYPDLFEEHPKSRYLLFTQENLDLFSVPLNLEKLTSTSIGDLYLNLDADCAEKSD
jgi:hypothetical protein